jgi:hypothetical protein
MFPYHSCKLIKYIKHNLFIEKKGRGLFLLKDRKVYKAKKKVEEEKTDSASYKQRRYGN